MGLDGASRNTRGIVDYITREGRELALVQEFQPQVVAGDKRVLLLDGRVLGVIRRVPRKDDIRANIHVGGQVEACVLTPTERLMVDDIAQHLAKVGLYFVGLDLIGEKLIEINVTSPTGIQELGRLTQTTPEVEVIKWVVDKVNSAGK
jgi:glutathione synthase